MGTANEGQQEAIQVLICSAATGTGNQTVVDLEGYDGQIMLECTAVGTIAAQAVTFTVQGSDDGTNFYIAGYQQVDNVASPTRAVAGFTQTPGNGTVRNQLKVLDAYRYYTVNISSNTLLTGLTVRAYAVPV